MALLGLFVLALALLWVYQIWDRKNRRLPPGPFQLPLIGNIWQIQQADSVYPYRALYKLSKKYGDIMSVKIGAVNAVAINGYETIKKVLNNEDFLNRFDTDWFLHRSFGKRIGILAAPTELWRPTRRFTMRHLRDFGFGKKYFQQRFLDTEMDELTRTLDLAIEQNKGFVEPQNLFRIPSINIAWASAAGSRFDHKDPKIIKLVNLMADFTQNAKIMEGVAAAYPILLKWFPKFFTISKLSSIDDEIHAFLKGLVNDIRERGTYKTEPDSFIEAFLQHSESDKISSPEDREVFSEESLISTLYDLFLAGSDTTSSSLTFALMWLTMYPEVQEKLRKELETVIGNERLPVLDDKSSLPYSRAVILELHRHNHLIPILPRKVYKDTHIDNYVIPGDSLVMVNVYSALMDEGFWGDPQNFRPSRFLDENSNIINADRVINFGAGKRNCIGEIIAESTIFVILIQLVQTYDFLPAEHGQIFDSDPIMGGVLAAKNYRIKVRRRK
jgi:methyl farnesoate epoxidase/farnesoate epoxidase